MILACLGSKIACVYSKKVVPLHAKSQKRMYMNSKRWLFIPLLIAVLAASGAPVVRIVDAAGADKDFAIDKIHKLVLTSTVVEVVNNEGSVLLSVPVSDIVRVELTDSESTPTSFPAVPMDDTRPTKILRNGQIYILYNGAIYTIQGQIIKNAIQ